MYKSIFTRLMVTYFVIIIVVLMTSSIILSTFFQGYIYDERTDALLREGKALEKYIRLYLMGLIDSRAMTYQYQVIDRFLNTTIWVTDERGYIWSSYSSEAFDGQDWENQKITVDDFVQVLQGNTITRVGSFGDSFDIPVLTVGMPLNIDGKIVGTIFLHSPIKAINETTHMINVNIWRSALICSALSIALLYFMSKNISSPLIEINNVSREIAKGNFKKRVKVKSKDEIGQLAVNFNAMANSLEELEDMRRNFVANISHELRSPLTSMRGYIQGVLDKTIPVEDQEKYLNIALEETERMNRLINDQLDLAQIESGQFSMHMQTVDINEKIRRVIIAREEQITGRNMDLKVDFEDELCLVEGDPDRLQQVIINLLDNAIKFNKDEGTITIKTWTYKDKVFVKVEDEGTGIPKEEIAHLWEPFYQVDKSRSKKKKGTGLGLSIVKKIIDAHGQEVWVNSEKDGGTAFIFSLKPIR